MDLDEKVVLVTGGASGLGELIARALADKNADVVILDEDGEKAADVAADILGYSQQCDVSKFDHAGVGVSSAMARFGEAPRLVVNAASVNYTGAVVSLGGKTIIPVFQRVMDVNVLGTYQITSFVAQVMVDLPPLSDGSRGLIVNLVPDLLENAAGGESAIAAAAGAVSAMTAPLAKDLKEHGVRVNTIAVAPKVCFENVKDVIFSLLADETKTGETIRLA